jgi:hypothetical protein
LIRPFNGGAQLNQGFDLIANRVGSGKTRSQLAVFGLPLAGSAADPVSSLYQRCAQWQEQHQIGDLSPPTTS